MSTQNGRLLNWLETHPNGITQLEAFNALGCCRLSERVREIEALGYVLAHDAEKTPGGARVIRYRLISVPDAPRWVLPCKPVGNVRTL